MKCHRCNGSGYNRDTYWMGDGPPRCPDCAGTGAVPTKKCPHCNGLGRVPSDSDEARKIKADALANGGGA